jgi:hypothetical protein
MHGVKGHNEQGAPGNEVAPEQKVPARQPGRPRACHWPHPHRLLAPACTPLPTAMHTQDS